MLRGLHRLLVAAADWQPRDFVIGVVGVEVVTLFAAVSLGFGTFAAYTHLSASQGPVFAASVICAAYGALALIGGAALARWHTRSSRRRPPALAPLAGLETLLQPLGTAGTTQDPMLLIAALRGGRELSPMEILAISLISGFFAGRKAAD